MIIKYDLHGSVRKPPVFSQKMGYDTHSQRKEKHMQDLQFDRIASPIGTILLVVDNGQVCALDYEDYQQRMTALLRKHYGSFHLLDTSNPYGFSSKIQAYFAGDYTALDTIPVNTGGTDFQRTVWSTLRSIPAGTTMTYGTLAAKLGKPAASRAVGATNALNPVAIILPCHRVIGANSSLTGYAGGLARKQWLLQHEGYQF
jgi:methylated-DNA-[protein]-cysteine S-methyltransferase